MHYISCIALLEVTESIRLERLLHAENFHAENIHAYLNRVEIFALELWKRKRHHDRDLSLCIDTGVVPPPEFPEPTSFLVVGLTSPPLSLRELNSKSGCGL